MGPLNTGKLQESFPVPLVPKWLCMLEYVPDDDAHARGTAIGSSGHPLWRYFCMRCPAVWAWMAVLLQFLVGITWLAICMGGCFHQASDLANTLIQDINVWMPHSTRFWVETMWLHTPPCGSTYGTSSPRNTWKNGKPRSSGAVCPQWPWVRHWSSVQGPRHQEAGQTRHVLIVRRQPHRSCCLNDEWLTQKGRPVPCPLKWDCEFPPMQESPLYPNWIVRNKTKPAGRDAPRPYQVPPKEDAGDGLTLEEETRCGFLYLTL